MLKNRDTSSNPYRVPSQPTRLWIKISLAVLFLFNLGLAGMLIYASKLFDIQSDITLHGLITT